MGEKDILEQQKKKNLYCQLKYSYGSYLSICFDDSTTIYPNNYFFILLCYYFTMHNHFILMLSNKIIMKNRRYTTKNITVLLRIIY